MCLGPAEAIEVSEKTGLISALACGYNDIRHCLCRRLMKIKRLVQPRTADEYGDDVVHTCEFKTRQNRNKYLAVLFTNAFQYWSPWTLKQSMLKCLLQLLPEDHSRPEGMGHQVP
jgi:hypothetical protein